MMQRALPFVSAAWSIHFPKVFAYGNHSTIIVREDDGLPMSAQFPIALRSHPQEMLLSLLLSDRHDADHGGVFFTVVLEHAARGEFIAERLALTQWPALPDDVGSRHRMG